MALMMLVSYEFITAVFFFWQKIILAPGQPLRKSPALFVYPHTSVLTHKICFLLHGCPLPSETTFIALITVCNPVPPITSIMEGSFWMQLCWGLCRPAPLNCVFLSQNPFWDTAISQQVAWTLLS